MSPEPVIAVLVLAFQGFEAALRRLNPLVLAEIRKELFNEKIHNSDTYNGNVFNKNDLSVQET